MGSQTLSSLRTDLLLHLDVRDDFDPATAVGLARLNLAINRAYRHVCLPKVYRHRELQVSSNITFVLDQRTYALSLLSPVPWAIQYFLSNYDDTRMVPRSFRQILDQTRNISSIPRAYAYWGQTIYLDHAPNSQVAGATPPANTFTAFYFRQPTALSLDADVTLLRDVWDQVIVHGATWYAWMMVNQAERAEDARTNFGLLVNEVGHPEEVEGKDEDQTIEIEMPEIMERAT